MNLRTIISIIHTFLDAENDCVIAVANCIEIPAIVRNGTVIGLQFHLESQSAGLELLKNIIEGLCHVKKRIIGVITVKDRLAVQSFGYKKYLPLGNQVVLQKILIDVDEILVQSIDRSANNWGQTLNYYRILGNLV